MSYDYARIKLKIGENEIEISGQRKDMDSLSALAMKMLEEASHASSNMANKQQIIQKGPVVNANNGTYEVESEKNIYKINQMPQVSLESNAPLSANILKLFSAEWGRKPRRLAEVKEILDNYGLVYPKQTVAVTLLRLAKEGKIRRFKSERGEYVYVSSATISVNQLIKQGEV